MLTEQQEQAIRLQLEGAHMGSGLGTGPDDGCSLAQINLALTGRLTAEIPDCMSLVVGQWIICIQDSMPDDMRNSLYWRELLLYAAGTGRERETERRDLILDWMWGTVLPELQPLADARGFGQQWQAMCDERTREAALVAKNATYAVGGDAVAAVDYAVAAVDYAAAYDTADTADAAYAAAYATVAYVYTAVAAAAYAAYTGVDADTADAAYWQRVSPPDLLAKLIAVG